MGTLASVKSKASRTSSSVDVAPAARASAGTEAAADASADAPAALKNPRRV
jgi:hypothetical protein